MTILFSGDWHLCMRNLEAVRTTVAQVVKILRKAKRPAYFFHLGDLVGDRGPCNPQDVRCTNFLIEAQAQIHESCDGSGFVRGNHDPITTADDAPSCTTLLGSLGVAWIADDSWTLAQLYFERLDLPSVNVYMVPYFRDTARQKKAFQDAQGHLTLNRKKGVTNILAFHNEVKGCERNAHSKGEGLTLADIGASDYDLCVAGHIHRPQQMSNVHFVGSPFCADWGDVNDSKRFLQVEI